MGFHAFEKCGFFMLLDNRRENCLYTFQNGSNDKLVSLKLDNIPAQMHIEFQRKPDTLQSLE